MRGWAAGGEALRRLREARGWSAARLAGELRAQAKRARRVLAPRESLVRRIYEWEAGTYRPRDYYELFILVYANADELASRSVAQGSDLDQLMIALGLMEVSMERRRFLLNSAALAVGVAVESTQKRLSILDLFGDPVSNARERLRFLRGLQYAGEPSGPIYTLLLAHAADIEDIAARFKGSDVERDLRTVQTQTLSTAGHTAFFNLGDHQAAEEQFRAGMRAAEQSSDSRLVAKLCVNLAHRRAHDPSGSNQANLDDALWVLNSGLSYADHNPFILTDIYDMEAFIYSALGDKYRTTNALERAATTIESAKSGDAPEWLSNVSMTHVQETAGCSFIRLGEARLAADQIARALEARSGATDRTHEALVLTWAAQASAKLKEPERAVSLLGQALPVVVKAGSRVRLGEIRAARAMLQPWEREPFVHEQLAGAGVA